MSGYRLFSTLEPDRMNRLIKTAIGQVPADMVIINGSVVNVYTKERMESCNVSICGDRIARVGPKAEHTIGPDTVVIDAASKTVIPGLIDGHTHLAWLFSATEFLKYAMKGGTTTIITETLEALPVAGVAGVIDFLESIRDQPIKILATAPPMVSISRAARRIAAQDLEALLDRDDILGLGETYWQAVIQEPDLYLPLFHQTLAAGKLLEGHSAGASFDKLSAYAAAGISSCHEPIKTEEVIDRLRMGIYVMVREGSIRRDLADIARIKDAGLDLRRLILSTDGVSPKDLIEKGYMEYVLQKAIDCGFDPIEAIQMATLNVAEHFHLDHLIGGIAPGRCADLLILPDIHTITPVTVISKGRVIAQGGEIKVQPRAHTYAPESMETIRLDRNMIADDFVIRVNNPVSTVKVRVIKMVSDLVTQEFYEDMPVIGGNILSDPIRDIVKVAAVDRTLHPGKAFTGLIQGFGLKSGAMACSAAWDSTAIIVVGASDTDMALAVNQIRKLQGGAVVCDNGRVLAELALPIFGLMSLLPIEALADATSELTVAAVDLGIPFPDPMLSLITLTGAAIPFLRICEEGLVNLKDGRRVDLIVEQIDHGEY